MGGAMLKVADVDVNVHGLTLYFAQLPPTATTEQVMISGAVFSTLNEAWDRFKRENGL